MENLLHITEDYALSVDRPLSFLVEEKISQGYRVLYKYQHPAVGMVYVLELDYSLVG